MSQKAVQEARRLIEKYEMNSAPIHIKRICEDCNIILIEDYDMTNLEHVKNREISGALLTNITDDDGENPETFIIANKKDSELRKRFTIAHELGHFFLHEGTVVSFRSERNPRETEANIFAAELLMPKELLETEYKKLENPSAVELAKIFKVSPSAMEVRLMNLGLNFLEFEI